MLLGTKTIFDATDKEPFTFQIGNNEVIQGWDLGIPKLSLGEKARLYIRSDFGYGEQVSDYLKTVVQKVPRLQFEAQGTRTHF